MRLPAIACGLVGLLSVAGGPALPLQAQEAGGEAFAVEPPLGLDLAAPVPGDNPLTAAKVALGRTLFFDPSLSSDSSLACASCHRPELAFTAGRPVSVGVHGRVGRRNVPTLVNAAYGKAFFWDGRTSTLEEQVVRPIQDPLEMDLALEDLVARLAASEAYRDAFAAAFRDRAVTAPNLARALASYLRTVRSGDAAYDRFLAGNTMAFSDSAGRGFELFFRRAGCGWCHSGPLLTDQRFHNTGVSWGSGDLGRYEVTGDPSDRGAFKPPTLRNVALTGPYMHDGSVATLEEVVDFYDRGGGANPYLDETVRPLGLTASEKDDLVAFLRSLTGAALIY